MAASTLRLLVAPLSPLRFSAFAALLILAAAGYCLSYGVVTGENVQPLISLSFGIASTLPWWCAWEGMKRASVIRKAWIWQITFAFLLLAALAGSAVLGFLVSKAFYPHDPDSIPQIVYARAPLMFALGLAAWLLLRPAAASPQRRPTWMGQQDTGSDGTASDGGCSGAEISATRRIDMPPPGDSIVLGVTPALDPEVEKSRVERPAQRASLMLKVPSRHGIVSVLAADIEYVKAAGNYVELVTDGRTLLMRTTLGETAARLRSGGFVRVHRSLLVNRHRVVGRRRDANGHPVITLQSGVMLPIGRRYSKWARDLLSEPPA